MTLHVVREREFHEDRSSGAVTVIADGHPQSYVNLADPTDLGFEYLTHLALLIDLALPEPPEPLAITHVGGAGLTLARYVQHTRPASPQIVFEPDEALTAQVRERLPLPRGHRIRVRAQPGRSGVAALREGSADVIVVDAFAAGRVPADLTTTQAAQDYRRVLRPGGTLLLNLADEPGLRYVARVAATLTPVLPHLALIATHDVLKGRRFGNAVLAASETALDEVSLRRALARSIYPSGARVGAELTALVRSARPLTDADGVPSPEPPDPGAWRAR